MYSMPWHVVWLDDSDLWCNMHGSHQALPYHKELSSLQNPFWSQLRRAGSIGVVITWVKRILQKHLASIANFVARPMFMHTLNASLLVSVALGRFRFGAERLHHCKAGWDRQTSLNINRAHWWECPVVLYGAIYKISDTNEGLVELPNSWGVTIPLESRQETFHWNQMIFRCT